MIRPLLAVALLVAVGALPSWRLVGRWLEALVVAPLLGGLVLVPGAVGAVLTATSPLPWVGASVLAVELVAWRRWRGRARWVPAGGMTAPLVVLGGLGALVVGYLQHHPPVDWDAHSIWLYHSSVYAEGGEAARRSFVLESFSHPEYPPLLTAPAGVLSRLLAGEIHWRLAQLVIVAMGWSAFATAALVIIDGARRRWVAAVGTLAIAAFAAAILYVGIVNAEADFAAAATVLLAAALLVRQPSSATVALGLVAASAAALCKGESFVAVLGVLAVGWWRAGRPRSWWWAVPAAVGVAWTGIARALGAESYLTQGEHGGLTPTRVLDRAWPSFERIVDELGSVAVASALASIAAAALVPSARRTLASIWLVALGSVGGLVAVYVIGDVPLEGWLDSSARRVATGPGLLVALALVVAIDRCADVALGAPPGPPDPP